MQRSMKGVSIGLGAVLAAVSMVGCPPKGTSAGRVDPTTTTDADRGSRKVLPVALMEFSDEVPRQLAQDLADLPIVRDTSGRVTVLMGDLNNKTGIVSSSEFEMVRSRIRNNLLQSDYVKQKLRFVESRDRMGWLMERELGSTEGAPASEEASVAYTLNGDFYRIERGDTNLYYMEFQLVHFGTNEIVFSKRYEVKQTRW